jgi:hypothetical protein
MRKNVPREIAAESSRPAEPLELAGAESVENEHENAPRDMEVESKFKSLASSCQQCEQLPLAIRGGRRRTKSATPQDTQQFNGTGKFVNFFNEI